MYSICYLQQLSHSLATTTWCSFYNLVHVLRHWKLIKGALKLRRLKHWVIAGVQVIMYVEGTEILKENWILVNLRRAELRTLRQWDIYTLRKLCLSCKKISVSSVCLGFLIPLKNFSLKDIIWRIHHYRWEVANFDIYLSLLAVDQWGVFSMLHTYWYRDTGHPLTLY